MNRGKFRFVCFILFAFKLAGGEQRFMLFANGKSTRDRHASIARECLGKTESDAKDLLRNTIVASVNKVYLDRYLEGYRRRQEKETTDEQQALVQGIE